ncbi:MAG: bifunctional 4-hydroxy-3-methylbut-2-enyl diphosphate reductase/30S ribosomal protein S1, partial [Bdellovibrio sp. CG12_big_fil_rev_8_21_14_0_65_39_13]
GYNSSNTKKLKKVCEDKGLEAYHIEKVSELNPEWFHNKKHVGITAGTSTPHWVIDEFYETVVEIGKSLEGSTPNKVASA